jgi:aspartate 1-decarboxylase
MLTRLLKAKIHRATVTQTEPDYHGSITIDSNLLRATGLLPNEFVLIADCENGNRFETYIIAGEPGSGVIAINGAAALLSGIGHRVIIMSHVLATPDQARTHVSRTLTVTPDNRPVETFEHKSNLP